MWYILPSLSHRVNGLALCDACKGQRPWRWATIIIWNTLKHSNLMVWCPVQTWICLKVCLNGKNSEMNLPISWHFCLSCPVILKDFFLHKADYCLLQFLFLPAIISLFCTFMAEILLCCQGNNLAERSGNVAIGTRKVLKNTNVSLI